jgi:hypothetical protein
MPLECRLVVADGWGCGDRRFLFVLGEQAEQAS